MLGAYGAVGPARGGARRPDRRRRPPLPARARRHRRGVRLGAHLRGPDARGRRARRVLGPPADRPPARRCAAAGAGRRRARQPGRLGGGSGLSARRRGADRRADPDAGHPPPVRGRPAVVGGDDDAGRALRRGARAHRTCATRASWSAAAASTASSSPGGRWTRCAPSPDRWGRDEVFFYGFDDLTRLEHDAIETLARIAGAAVTVSLTYEAGRAGPGRAGRGGAGAPPAGRRGARAAGARRPLRAGRARRRCTTSSAVCSSPTPDRIDPGSAVALLEAGGERAEAELIAGRILALLRAGIPGGEIAVVCRSLAGASRRCVTRVFAEYGVAAGVRGRAPSSRTRRSGGRCGARRAARCSTSDEARAEDLLAYLRAPGLLAGPRSPTRSRPALARDGLTSAAAARERLGWDLHELDELAAAADPGAVLCAPGPPPAGRARTGAARRRLDDGGGARRPRAGRARAARWTSWRSSAWRLLGPELLELLEELTVPDRRPARRRTTWCSPSRSRSAPGASGSCSCAACRRAQFPLAGASRAVPLRRAPPRARARPRACGWRSPRTRWTASATCSTRRVSRATERVVLSYRSSDEEGNLALAVAVPRRPPRAVRAPAWFERRERRLLADVVWPAGGAPTERERRRAAGGGAGPGGRRAARARAAAGCAAALARLRHTEILSAGALETYADCPVKWLVERELDPAPLEPEPEPIARGNLIHAVARGAAGRARRSASTAREPAAGARDPRPAPVRARRRSRARSSAPAGPRSCAPGCCAAIEADLRRYLRHEAAEARAGGRPASSCASGSSDDRARFAARARARAGRRARAVRGMIDRVDVDGAGHALIRDYKSGAARSDWPVARWGADRRLQVALYLLVVRELTELEPVAGFYQPLRGEDLRARGMFVEGEPSSGRRVHDRDRGARPRSSPPSSTTPASAPWRWPAALRAGRGHPVSADLLARRLRISRGSAAANERAGGVDAGAEQGDRAPHGRPAARRQRRERQDLGPGRAVRRRRARGRDRRRRDPDHHLHREGGGRAARPDPGPPARARRDRGRRAPPRARSSRPFTASAPACCAPERSPPASTRRSSVLDADQSEPLADAAFDGALLDLAPAGADAVALIADYGAAALRAAIRSRLRAAALARAAPPRPAGGTAACPGPRRPGRPGGGGAGAGRRARGDPRSRQPGAGRARARSSAARRCSPGPRPVAGRARPRSSCPATAPRSAPTPARPTARRWRRYREACAARAAVPVRDLHGPAAGRLRRALRARPSARCRESTSRTSSCWRCDLLRDRAGAAPASTPSASSGSWSTSSRTPTASSSS